MNAYFSTFITGFDDIVADELNKCLRGVEIVLLNDGLVVYKTTSSKEEIKKLRFLNNSFVLLKKFDKVSESSTNNILKSLIKDESLVNIVCQSFPRKILKFRIRASVKNQFVSIDRNLLVNFEDKITQNVHNFRVDRSLPDMEFLITVRSEGFGLAGAQFTSRPNYERTLEKGELYPELAYILCLISEPNENEVFFDPFAGHGSIPAQRLNFPHKQIMAGEIDRDLQRKLEIKFGKRVVVAPVDALSLSTISDNSIDKIVTDPPWGLYDTGKDIPKFYFLMLKQFTRVLKHDGTIVILTAQKELMEDLLSKFEGQLKLEEKYSTLVSGKKAGVYKIKKIIVSLF
jgi:tRNA G10  N-methylase Trm11